VLSLLRFAYVESMGAWMVPYSLAGLFLAFRAGTRLERGARLPCATFVLALFFSLSIVLDRMAVPIPTLFAAGLWVMDAVLLVVQPGCGQSGEDCFSPGPGLLLIVVPLVIQWLLVYALAAGASWAWRRGKPRLSRQEAARRA
jgi:hypothetical protein